MSGATFALVKAKTAVEVCSRYEPDEIVLDLVTAEQTPFQLLDLLMEKQLYADACRFLAQCLPKREAVWWAWQCARQAPPGKKPAQEAAALQLVERWIHQPNEANRRPAQAAAEAAKLGSPAGAVALAVYFSGGSLTPPDQVPVPPPEHVTGVSAATAVILSAVLGDPAQTEERYRRFLALGIEVANGTNRWPEPPADARK